MARRAVGVDIGSRYVKVVEVVRDGSHARVVHAAAEEIRDATAAARAEALTRALRAAGIRGRKVSCDVARADAVVKRVRLPATDRETVRKMLEFEAQQHVPFPLEEMAWDFDLQPDGSVLLTAARRSSLDEVRAILGPSGVRATAINVTSGAVASAYLAQSRESGESAAGADEQTAVLIELGAGPAIANVFRGGSWLLSRALPVSGDDLTAAFAADLGCDLAHARAVRESKGWGGLPSDAPRVRAWVQDLRTEVERSLLAAAEQTATLTVERVAATGGGWLTPGLLPAVSSALGLTVEPSPAGLEQVTPIHGAAVALALQGVGLVDGADLLPSTAIRARAQARRSVGSAVAIAALVVALGVGGWRYWTVQQQSLALAPAREAAARRERQTRTLISERKALEAQLREVQDLLRPRHKVLNVLKELSAKAPAGIWLTSVAYAPGRQVAVQGRAASSLQVSDLLQVLGGQAALTYVKQGETDVDFAITMCVDQGG